MYVMPLGPAASLVGVWHRGQRHQPWLESPAFHRRFRVKQTHNEPGSQMQLPSLSLFVHEVTSDLWWSLVIFAPLMRLTSGVFWGDITRIAPSDIQWLTVASRKTDRQVARPAISFEECKQRCFARLNHLGQDLKPWRSVHQRIQKVILN